MTHVAGTRIHGELAVYLPGEYHTVAVGRYREMLVLLEGLGVY